MNDKKFYETYKIQKGDTLYAVSKKYNINPELLSLLNGLTMSDYIYENQEIIVPKSGYSYYLTQSGDKLSDVIKLFNTNYNDFIKTNENIMLESGQLFAFKRV